MNEPWNEWLQPTLTAAGWYAAGMLTFIALARLWPCNPSAKPNLKQIATDLFYYLVPSQLYGWVYRSLLLAFLLLVFAKSDARTYEYLSSGSSLAQLPIPVQILLILLISDVMQYWLHRWFHGSQMWRFHAIHHAPEHVDWHTSARFHPVNFLLYVTPAALVTGALGFSLEAFILMQPFNVFYSFMVHANLNWTFGPFKYVLASPVFHRWHHTSQAEGRDKNFAPTFPFLDMMFGTFYMPKDKVPERYGIAGNPVPDNLLGQMIYPFTRSNLSDRSQ